MQEPQDLLLKRIIDSMPSQGVVEVDEVLKKKLADVIRSFYKAYPEAIALQARCLLLFSPNKRALLMVIDAWRQSAFCVLRM